MGSRRFTLILAALTALALILSVPASLREAWARGHFYLFSREFIDDLPRRLTGPGRFRFLFQPIVAILLGIRDGRNDARAGLPSYLSAGFFRREPGPTLRRSGFRSVVNLLLMGILLDSLSQWLILGTSYPFPALIVGPVLIGVPYALTRHLTNLGPREPGATSP